MQSAKILDLVDSGGDGIRFTSQDVKEQLTEPSA
jgi:hypothetical protein